MKNLYVFCEGHTEEAFINNLLQDYFASYGICIKPIVCRTSDGKAYKFTGGVYNYPRFEFELKNICKQHHNEHVTMMFDYYRLPKDFPGMDSNQIDVYEKVWFIEKQIEQRIAMRNFKAYLSMHEFESLLFSRPESFSLAEKAIVPVIKKIKDTFGNPELINNSPLTAPSKRIAECYPRYSKKRDGIIIAKDIGLQKIMQECKHFREWIEGFSMHEEN